MPKSRDAHCAKSPVRISVSASVLVAYLKILSDGRWLAVLIGFKPLPGSLQAAPIAMSYGWTEVSLSLRMGLRLKWHHHLFIAWAKSLAFRRFYQLGMQKQEPVKWSWRACNAAILHGHAGNVPDKIVFGYQRAMRAINLSLYYPLHFRGKIGTCFARFREKYFPGRKARGLVGEGRQNKKTVQRIP